MSNIGMSIAQGPRDGIEDNAVALQLTLPLPRAAEVTILLGCDGVAGNKHGEVASENGISAITQRSVSFFLSQCAVTSIGPDEVLHALVNALEQANELILQQARSDVRLSGMATTAVAAVIVGSLLHIAWVGDSRCYVCRNGCLRQVTRDHSEAQRLVDAGVIPACAAREHPLAHTINRYLGQPIGLQVDTRLMPLRAGDRILVCTDGLTDVLRDSEIVQIISGVSANGGSPEQVAARLVDEALAVGATDNVTAVICDYDSSPRSSGQDQATLIDAYTLKLAAAIERTSKEHSS